MLQIVPSFSWPYDKQSFEMCDVVNLWESQTIRKQSRCVETLQISPFYSVTLYNGSDIVRVLHPARGRLICLKAQVYHYLIHNMPVAALSSLVMSFICTEYAAPGHRLPIGSLQPSRCPRKGTTYNDQPCAQTLKTFRIFARRVSIRFITIINNNNKRRPLHPMQDISLRYAFATRTTSRARKQQLRSAYLPARYEDQ